MSAASIPSTSAAGSASAYPSDWASFKISSTTIRNTSNFKVKIEDFLKKTGPGVCQIITGENQELIPRVQTKMRKDGTFVPTSIDDMYPYLERKEYDNNKSYLTDD